MIVFLVLFWAQKECCVCGIGSCDSIVLIPIIGSVKKPKGIVVVQNGQLKQEIVQEDADYRRLQVDSCPFLVSARCCGSCG